ncbi:MAG: DUF3108 domain-containing protein [Betaproteobacteria bacterium]|nr:DUF3108 domain-containing protein [Betaproteobacteria bacterium]
MPFAFALVASALLHAAALLGPGWVLPGTHEPEPTTTIEAVLAPPPAPAPAPAPVAKAAPKPPPVRPRPQPAAQPVVTAAAPAEIAAAPAAAEAPPAAAPVAAPPAAVAPAPSARDTVSGSAGDITPEPPAPQPANTALPGKGSTRYVITRGEGGFIIGRAVHSWTHDGFTYRLKSLTETTGLAAAFKPVQVLQSSEGEITAEGLRPREFRHERAGSIDTANFDWTRRVVRYAAREDGIVAGTQDMLSMYYQLVLLAPQSGVVEMPVATGRKLEIFRLEVLGEEVLTLPGGERRALHVRTRTSNDTIELWLRTGADAASRGLPLKIRFIDRRGDIYDQIADDLDSARSN